MRDGDDTACVAAELLGNDRDIVGGESRDRTRWAHVAQRYRGASGRTCFVTAAGAVPSAA